MERVQDKIMCNLNKSDQVCRGGEDLRSSGPKSQFSADSGSRLRRRIDPRTTRSDGGSDSISRNHILILVDLGRPLSIARVFIAMG
jgi:hypothetical protein